MGEVERVGALKSIRIMGTSPEPEFDRFARLAGHVAVAGYAHVCFIDEVNQFAKAADGLSLARTIPREKSICIDVVESQQPVVIADLTADPRAKCREVSRLYGLKSYAGVPIRWPGPKEHHVIGALATLSYTKQTPSARRLAALEECSALVTRELLLRQAAGVKSRATAHPDTLKAVTKNHLAVLRAVSDGVFILRENGTIAFVNPAAQQILTRPTSSLLGSSFSVSVSVSAQGAPLPKSECPVAACLRDGMERFARSALFLRSDHQTVGVEYVVSPLKIGRQSIGTVVVFRPVANGSLSSGTELRNTLREVAKLKEQIAKLETLRVLPDRRLTDTLPELGEAVLPLSDLLDMIEEEHITQLDRARQLCDGRVDGAAGAAALLGVSEAAYRQGRLVAGSGSTKVSMVEGLLG